MTFPTLVQFFTDTATGTTALSTGSFAVQADDLIVVKTAGQGSQIFNTPTASGLTFTSHIAPAGSVGRCYIFSATCPSTTSITVTGSPASSGRHDWVVEHWRNAGVDATPAIINAVENNPLNRSITTEAADSVVTWIVVDNNENTAVAPTYREGSGAVTEEIRALRSGAYTFWSPYQEMDGAAGSKTVGWTVPASGINGRIAALEVQFVSGSTDATAEPAVIAATVAVPRSAVGAGAGPATAATVVAVANAARNVAAGPGSVAAVVSLVRPAGNISAGPAAIPTDTSLPAASAGSPATATPAAIACTVALARPAVNSAAGPAVAVVAVAVPSAAVDVSAGPQVVATVAALTGASVAVSAGAAAVGVVVAVDTPTVGAGESITAQPATIAVAVTVPAPAVQTSATVTPAPVTTVVAIGRPGVNIAAGPATLVAAAALLQAAAGAATAATPATIQLAVLLPAVAVNTGAGPATVPAAVAVLVPVAGEPPTTLPDHAGAAHIVVFYAATASRRLAESGAVGHAVDNQAMVGTGQGSAATTATTHPDGGQVTVR